MLNINDLPTETKEALDELTARTGQTHEFYLKNETYETIDQALWEYSILADLDDIYSGRERTYTLEEVTSGWEN